MVRGPTRRSPTPHRSPHIPHPTTPPPHPTPQCDYDAEAHTARCFCNDGWAGNDCSQPAGPPPSGLSPTGAVLLAVSLLLMGTLAFL